MDTFADPSEPSRRDVLRLAAVAALPLPIADAAPASATYRSPAEMAELERFGDPSATRALRAALSDLPPIPAPPFRPLAASWTHALGSPSEGHQTDLSRLPASGSPTRLPHRSLPADHPFWYWARVELPGPCVLRFRADDGAHLWVDGRRIVAEGEEFFLPAARAGAAEVVIRVLNKAMFGGLAEVLVADASAYQAWRNLRDERIRLNALVEKLRTLREPPTAALRDAALAVQGDAAGRTRAERRLAALPRIVAGPVVLPFDDDTTRIVWKTDVLAEPSLEVAVGEGPFRRVSVEVRDGAFTGRIRAVPPATIVRYRVRNGRVVEPERTFRTLPREEKVAFTMWADPHVGGTRFAQNVAAMLGERPDFTIGVGDLVVDADRLEPWARFFELGAPLFATTPAFLLAGNHEYDGCFESLRSPHYERLCRDGERPYFAWTAGPARFVALDPNLEFPTGISRGSDQHRFLEAELARPEWRAATWRFILVHQPIYGAGWTGYQGDLPLRALLDPLIESARVDFVVSGHIHDYERLTRNYGGHKCTHLIIGGAGGGLSMGTPTAEPVMDKLLRRHHFCLVNLTPERARFEVVGTDTVRLDAFEQSR